MDTDICTNNSINISLVFKDQKSLISLLVWNMGMRPFEVQLTVCFLFSLKVLKVMGIFRMCSKRDSSQYKVKHLEATH